MSIPELLHLPESGIVTINLDDYVPQTGPCRFISRVIHREAAFLTAEYVVPIDPFWAPYHFPGRPLMPGVLIIESLNQAFVVLIRLMLEEGVLSDFDPSGHPLLHSVKFKVRGSVQPGETYSMTVKYTGQKMKRLIFGEGTAHIGGKVIAESEITGALR